MDLVYPCLQFVEVFFVDRILQGKPAFSKISNRNKNLSLFSIYRSYNSHSIQTLKRSKSNFSE